jgi:hypothetical protein
VTSLDRLIVKKSKKKESTAPVLTVNEATVMIQAAEMRWMGDEVTKRDGTTFTVEKPHIACEMELVDAPKRKHGDIGTTWYEKLYYPETKKGSGEYENRQGTKIGAITEARYGEDFWDDEDAVLDPEDLVGFRFYCNLVPKTEFGGTKVTGTRIDHDSVEPLEKDPGEDEETPEAPDFSLIKGKGN